MRSDGVYLSLTDLFHLAQCPQSLFLLSQMARFHRFMTK